MQDANQVDDRVSSARQPVERSIIVHVALDDVDCRQHDQVACAGPAPRRDDHAKSTSNKPRDNVTADETSAADDQDLGVLHFLKG